MKDEKSDVCLESLSEDVFGISLEAGRAEVVARELGEILTEINRLRSLDLSGVDPVVVFDPVKAARPERSP